ncbi:cytochrome P450 [Karstenula rhodostoma CBS 690.94]|uniref:Cytochrome P450 n=1 Tax=Karstenula rhodostoma CBS 690.94 TaxID=1392251 RepID=A0A9P4P6U2_9PLEO|nr:cytochrome P450 [Karstenula rhodostoma CBS 690.94]
MGFLETVAILTATWLIATLTYGLYNLTLHPLRRYPGPPLYAAYRLSYVIANIRGKLPFEVLDMHRKYGPVVRIAPNELAFTEPAAWNDIYGPGTATDAAHARLRRIYRQAFTPKAIEGPGGMLLKYADLLVEQLKVSAGREPVQDMSAWFNYAMFDLTGDFSFGETFHCLDSGGKSHFSLDTVLERYKLLTILSPLLALFAGDELKKAEMMGRYTKELNKKKEDQLNNPELYENALTLVVAGSETTGTLLSGVVYFLCKHPDVLEKVQEEVRAAFKRDEEITPTSVNGLEYMVAVLSETMRVFPPAGFGFPRIISSKGGQSVAGGWVPEQTRCSIFHHAAYRYEDNFARPEDFIPERWLVGAPAEFKDDKKEVLQPFMVGPRGCIGKGLAYVEMRLFLAKMLWHFDFELADPTQQWHERLRAYLASTAIKCERLQQRQCEQSNPAVCTL